MGTATDWAVTRALALRVLGLAQAAETVAALPPLEIYQAQRPGTQLDRCENVTRAARELAELLGAISRQPNPDQLPLGNGNGWDDVRPYLSADELRASPDELRAEGAAMAPAAMERWRELHGCEVEPKSYQGGAL